MERREDDSDAQLSEGSVDKSILELARELEDEINRNIGELQGLQPDADVPDEVITLRDSNDNDARQPSKKRVDLDDRYFVLDAFSLPSWIDDHSMRMMALTTIVNTLDHNEFETSL